MDVQDRPNELWSTPPTARKSHSAIAPNAMKLSCHRSSLYIFLSKSHAFKGQEPFPSCLQPRHVLPCFTIITCNPYLNSDGILNSKWACASTGLASSGTHPSILVNRNTCVSTAKACLPRQKDRTHAAVLGPTPLYDTSSRMASPFGISFVLSGSCSLSYWLVRHS